MSQLASRASECILLGILPSCPADNFPEVDAMATWQSGALVSDLWLTGQALLVGGFVLPLAASTCGAGFGKGLVPKSAFVGARWLSGRALGAALANAASLSRRCVCVCAGYPAVADTIAVAAVQFWMVQKAGWLPEVRCCLSCGSPRWLCAPSNWPPLAPWVARLLADDLTGRARLGFASGP